MKRFVEGEDRRQTLLLPESLDDYVTEDNPVRVVRSSSMSLIWVRLALKAFGRRRRGGPPITPRRC